MVSSATSGSSRPRNWATLAISRRRSCGTQADAHPS